MQSQVSQAPQILHQRPPTSLDAPRHFHPPDVDEVLGVVVPPDVVDVPRVDLQRGEQGVEKGLGTGRLTPGNLDSNLLVEMGNREEIVPCYPCPLFPLTIWTQVPVFSLFLPPSSEG